MPNKIYILIPGLDDTAPIKWAVTLANGLSEYFDVVLVLLKGIRGQARWPKPAVSVVSLAPKGGLWKKYLAYKKLIEKNAISISLCFSADVVNWMLRGKAVTISTVRGNLPINYHLTYGWFTRPVAYFHFMLLRSFDHVVAISKSMANQLRRFGVKRIQIIGNFLDEEYLEASRAKASKASHGPIHFLFLGRLTKLKRPDLLLEAAARMAEQGVSVQVSIVGDGPTRKELEALAKKLGLETRVKFYGHISNPYPIIQGCDCLVLPSESEGISRAILEALFYGIPCIARDVDGNRELIRGVQRGYLFKRDEDLFSKMVAMTKLISGCTQRYSANLIPAFFRQQSNIRQFKQLLERV